MKITMHLDETEVADYRTDAATAAVFRIWAEQIGTAYLARVEIAAPDGTLYGTFIHDAPEGGVP